MSEADQSTMPPPAVPTSEPPNSKPEGNSDKVEGMDFQQSSQAAADAAAMPPPEKPTDKKTEVSLYMKLGNLMWKSIIFRRRISVLLCKVSQLVNIWIRLLYLSSFKVLVNWLKNVLLIRSNFWENICFVKKTVLLNQLQLSKFECITVLYC